MGWGPAVIWALAMLASAPAAAQQGDAYRGPNAEEERAGERWIAAHGHVLSGATPSAAELEPIVARLRGARVIGLGEATHGTHEDQAFKAALVEALVRGGAIDVIAVEANRSAVAGFDRYVRTGKGDLDALVRSDSFFRIWRTDEFAGLLRWLRDWNRGRATKVRLVGIDMQDAQRDAEEALGYVATVDPTTAARLRAGLAPRPAALTGKRPVDFMRWAMTAPAVSFNSSRAAVDALDGWFEARAAGHVGDPAFAEAREAGRGAQQGFAVAAPFNNADPRKITPEEWQRRDVLMANNLLALATSGHRVALWAHNSHVLAEVPAAIRQQGVLSLGMRVRDVIGPAYRTVGVTWSRATVLLTAKTAANANTMFPEADDKPAALLNDGPGTAGSEFDRAAPNGAAALWVDLDAAARDPALAGWKDRALYKGETGWLYDPADWQRGPVEQNATPIGSGFDLLVWFRRMTPSHRWAGKTR